MGAPGLQCSVCALSIIFKKILDNLHTFSVHHEKVENLWFLEYMNYLIMILLVPCFNHSSEEVFITPGKVIPMQQSQPNPNWTLQD